MSRSAGELFAALRQGSESDDGKGDFQPAFSFPFFGRESWKVERSLLVKLSDISEAIKEGPVIPSLILKSP